jgi:hypothetical protein
MPDEEISSRRQSSGSSSVAHVCRPHQDALVDLDIAKCLPEAFKPEPPSPRAEAGRKVRERFEERRAIELVQCGLAL